MMQRVGRTEALSDASQKVEVSMKRYEEKTIAAVNETAPAAAPAAAPKTLRELGIDAGLAADFELAFRLMGKVQGGQVVGYTFATPDGQRHTLRVEAGAEPPVARAA